MEQAKRKVNIIVKKYTWTKILEQLLVLHQDATITPTTKASDKYTVYSDPNEGELFWWFWRSWIILMRKITKNFDDSIYDTRKEEERIIAR